MSRKAQPAQPGDKARLEVVFDRPQLLGQLFGHYDQNLVAIENALGVYIAARGNKLQIEGEAGAIARARDVLTGLYNRIVHGQEVDAGAVSGIISMSAARRRAATAATPPRSSRRVSVSHRPR